MEFLLFYILGLLFIPAIYYLTSNYLEKQEKTLFTKGISSDVITFTRDYQEILSNRIEDDNSYLVIYRNTYYHVLTYDWTFFDIKDWLNSLDEQDYAITIDMVFKSSEGLILENPKIILSNEFMVNKHSNPIIISSLLSTQIKNQNGFLNLEYNENYYIKLYSFNEFSLNYPF